MNQKVAQMSIMKIKKKLIS